MIATGVVNQGQYAITNGATRKRRNCLSILFPIRSYREECFINISRMRSMDNGNEVVKHKALSVLCIVALYS